jgi:hypothetical protein
MPRPKRTRKSAPASAGPLRAGGFLTDTAAARPLASLVFLAPLMVTYAVGLIWVRPDLAATADIWLREAMRFVGVSGALAPTWLAVVVLLVWHLVRRDPWQVSWKLLGLMALETVLLAVPLLVIERGFQVLWQAATLAVPPDHASSAETWLEAVMTSIGAGIYEELLFRLLMVGGALFVLTHILKDDSTGACLAVVLIAAALFAAAHEMNPAGFAWTRFLFRSTAGVYLGYVFLYRGFGVATGVHILFDLVLKILDAIA